MTTLQLEERLTKLFFIRHGKTEWNLEGRYQGANGDSLLLKESYAEIEELAKYLDQYEFAKIYCSPLKRARDTAETIATKLHPKVEVKVDEAFREFDLGKMEGMKFTEVAKKYPKELLNFRHHPDLYDPSKINGESFEELIARMTPKIKEISQKYPDQNVIIVSHGAALCAAIRSLMGVPLAKLREKGGLANTSTTILETHDQKTFTCLAWNKTDYLKRKLDKTDVV